LLILRTHLVRLYYYLSSCRYIRHLLLLIRAMLQTLCSLRLESDMLLLLYWSGKSVILQVVLSL